MHGNNPDEHATKTLHEKEGQNISCSHKKISKYSQRVSATIMVQVNQLTSLGLKAKVIRLETDGKCEADQYSLDCLLSKWCDGGSTTSTNKQKQ